MFRPHSAYLLLSAIFAFLKVTLYSKILGPKYYGAMDLVFTIGSFVPYIAVLGLDQALARQLGRFFATKNYKNIIQLRNQVFTFCLVVFSSVSAVYFIVTLIWFSKNTLVRDVMISIIPFSMGTIITNLLLIEYRAGQNLNAYSKILALRNFLTILLGILTAYFLKNIIFITLAEFLANLFIFFILMSFLKDLRLNFNFGRYLKLLVRKFAFFNISALLRSCARSFDRGIIVYALTLTDLGYYSFSMILLSGGIILSGIMSTYLEPRWIIEYKMKKDAGKILNDSIRIGCILVLLALIIYYPFVKISAYFITKYFYDFKTVLVFIPWIFIGTVFYTINFFENFFLSIGRGAVQLSITIINIVVSIIVSGSIAILAPSLINFSIGFCAISIISYFVGLILALYVKNSYKQVFKLKEILK